MAKELFVQVQVQKEHLLKISLLYSWQYLNKYFLGGTQYSASFVCLFVQHNFSLSQKQLLDNLW